MPAQLTDTYGWSMDHGSLTALEGTRVNCFLSLFRPGDGLMGE